MMTDDLVLLKEEFVPPGLKKARQPLFRIIGFQGSLCVVRWWVPNDDVLLQTMFPSYFLIPYEKEKP